MLLHLLLTAGALSLTACLTWRGKDAWPFTRYPMFARPLTLGGVKVIRFSLETTDGRSIPWKPRFSRDAHRVGDRIGAQTPAEILWAVSEVIRLIGIEEGDTRRYKAIEVVECRWTDGAPSSRRVARIPLKDHAFVG